MLRTTEHSDTSHGVQPADSQALFAEGWKMTTQRLVFWSIRDFGIEVTPANPVVVDLNHDALLKRYPALAKAIGRGRVTSHSIVHWGAAGPIITFIVED